MERLAQAPDALTGDEVEGLREVGYDDTGILHVVLGASHFSYLNRVADGVGIPFDYESVIEDVPLDAGTGADAVARAEWRRGSGDPGRIGWIDVPRQEGAGAPAGGPANLWRVVGMNAEAGALVQAWRAYQLQGTAGLDGRTRAAVALLAAGISGCGYSARWFREAFEREGGAGGDADRLAAGEVPAGAAGGERVVLDHARRLTIAPWTTREEHVAALRGAGLDDRGVLQVTMLVAYVSFEVRVALGLGVAEEPRAD